METILFQHKAQKTGGSGGEARNPDGSTFKVFEAAEFFPRNERIGRPVNNAAHDLHVLGPLFISTDHGIDGGRIEMGGPADQGLDAGGRRFQDRDIHVETLRGKKAFSLSHPWPHVPDGLGGGSENQVFSLSAFGELRQSRLCQETEKKYKR